MNAPFFLVATKNKLFLSHVDRKVVHKWDISPEQLWYENSRGYIGAYGTDLMLVDDDHQYGTSGLMPKNSFDKLNFSGYTGKPRLRKHRPQMYSVRGASVIVHNRDKDDHGNHVLTLGQEAPPDMPLAIFRKIYAHDFLGCVHWDAAYHTTSNPSFVEEGLQAIQELGFGIAKVKVNNPSDSYRGRVPDHDPTSIVDTIEKVFKRSLSSFHTIILSVWSTFDWDESYFLGLEGAELEDQLTKEYEFFFHLTQYLESAFENKTIVLQNWESDWKFKDIKDNPVLLQKVVRWIKARQKGVSEGRNSKLRSRSTKVLHALEINKVEQRSLTNVSSLVLPNVDVDLVSYSMYEEHGHGVLSRSLDYIQDLMNQPSRYMQQLARMDERFVKRVYLGEYGTGYLDQVDKNKDILVNAISWGCPFALYWQVFENEWEYDSGINAGRGLLLPLQDEDVVEGMVDPVDVRETDVGEWFASLLPSKPRQGTTSANPSADPVMGFNCVQPYDSGVGEKGNSCAAQLGGKYRTLADCEGQCHNATKLGDILPNLMQKIATYVPLAPVATNREAVKYGCTPTAFEYQTLRDPAGPCPPEARFQEPNSLCCSSGGPEELHQSSQKYLGILRTIYKRRYDYVWHRQWDGPELPDDLRRVLNWINHPDNLADFPTFEGQELRLPMDYPYFKDIVKFVIMMTSEVTIVAFYDNPADSRTYKITEPIHFDTHENGYVKVHTYPEIPVNQDIIDAINECGRGDWGPSNRQVVRRFL